MNDRIHPVAEEPLLSASASPPPTALASEFQDIIIENEQGVRRPASRTATWVIFSTALAWSLFQLWLDAPLQYPIASWFNGFPWMKAQGWSFPVFDHDGARPIHLAFAIFLAFLLYPAFRRSPRLGIPIMDWLLAILAAGSALYCYFYGGEISHRSGKPNTQDIIVAFAGLLLLLEAIRRALGLPLVIIGITLLLYSYFGDAHFIPEVLRHKSASPGKIASHMWLTQEGVFGIALGVSNSFVFLFVLFGVLLDKAGAANYFIKLSFALLGHLRGGAAKVAVVSSALTGMMSGSSIANVVTTGTFIIPMMKRAGFSGEKAGAIKVAASVDGQILPPVMGTAAFLMVEYVGIPYAEVLRHAFLPAILSYVALFYIVHLEALKTGMTPLPRFAPVTARQRLIFWGITISGLITTMGVIYYAVTALKAMLGDHALGVFIVLLFGIYLGLMRYTCRFPELEIDDPDAPLLKLPALAPTFQSGLHFLLPIAVLVWCLMVERFSPGLSAFWSVMLMLFILVTQPMLKVWFKGGQWSVVGGQEKEISDNHRLLTTDYRHPYKSALKRGLKDAFDGMTTGARNMVGIGVATAAAGIVVGVVSMTGIGNVMAEAISTLAGNSLLLILLLTALICIILGMGMPTTASYIVVATLMAHVVQELGLRNGVVLPLIAIHLFVFYFGLMADVMPPVGLAAMAAAAISGANPLRTSICAFTYSIRTAMLPFFFIYNTELLLIGVQHWWQALWVLLYSSVAVLLFASVLQGYFLVRSRWPETIMLLVASVIMFLPNVCNDWLHPPYKALDMRQFKEGMVPAGVDADGEATLRLSGEGASDIGDPKPVWLSVPLNGKRSVPEIINDYGIIWRLDGTALAVNDIKRKSAAFKDKVNFTYVIHKIELPQEQPSSKLMYIPAMLLLGFVIMSQTSRKRKESVMRRFTG